MGLVMRSLLLLRLLGRCLRLLRRCWTPPSLQDDFYLNLVDWSSQNLLAVGLGTCVYLWNASNSNVTKLCDLGPNDSVCAVHWTREGSYVSVGTSNGLVQVWDVTQCERVRSMTGHQTRAGVLSWSSQILASGS